MTDTDLPAWFKVYADSIERRIDRLEDAMGRGMRELGVKAEDNLREARRTNGRMTRAEDRLSQLEKDDANNLLSRQHHSNRITQLIAAIIGGGGAVLLLLAAEALKSVH